MKTPTIALVYLLTQHVVVDAQLANVPIKRRRVLSTSATDRHVTDNVSSLSQQQEQRGNTTRLLKKTGRKSRLLLEEDVGSISIATDESMSILLSGSNSIPFLSSTLTKYIATCNNQPVFDIYNFYEDVPLSPSSVLSSKVVNDADNGTCDISTIDNGLSLKMAYYPSRLYAGQDKCDYVMCMEKNDGESECRFITFTINVEECPVSAVSSMSMSLKGMMDWVATDSTGEEVDNTEVFSVVAPQLRPTLHQSSKSSKSKAKKCGEVTEDFAPVVFAKSYKAKSPKCRMKTISVAQGFGPGTSKSGKALLDILPTPVPKSGSFGPTEPVILPVTDDCTIEDIQVEIRLDHTFAGDLEIDLVSPCEETVTLVDQQGGSANPSSSSPIIFNDNTGVNLPGNYPFGGTYISEGRKNGIVNNMLSNITGGTHGNWTLNIFDRFGGDSGTLQAVNLTIDAICCRG